MKLLHASALVLCLLGSAVSAAEVDSFTDRRPLRDSAPLLDAIVNRWLDEAVTKAGRADVLPVEDAEFEPLPAGCDVDRLDAALRERFVGFLEGPLESLVNRDPRFDVVRVPFEHSIYSDFEFLDSPVISLTRRMAVLLRVGEVYLGSDKFGHFFTEGHTYFRLYATTGRASALQFGELTESTFYGELTTGVFSYADLAANLNGMRFWNEVLGALPDPLTGAPVRRPYVRCEGGRWRLVRRFHWRDYVDPAWDEAYNCNDFRNAPLLEKARRRIAAATGGGGCPLGPVDRERLARKYGDLLALVYNPEGNRVLAGRLAPKLERLFTAMLERLRPQARHGNSP